MVLAGRNLVVLECKVDFILVRHELISIDFLHDEQVAKVVECVVFGLQLLLHLL